MIPSSELPPFDLSKFMPNYKSDPFNAERVIEQYESSIKIMVKRRSQERQNHQIEIGTRIRLAELLIHQNQLSYCQRAKEQLKEVIQLKKTIAQNSIANVEKIENLIKKIDLKMQKILSQDLNKEQEHIKEGTGAY